MGNVLSPSADLVRKAFWISKKRDGDYGRPFVEIIKDHYLYGPWIDTKTVYELNLVHRLPNLHWYLLVKKEGASDWPYITLEITTSGKKDLIPLTRDFESCDDNATGMGTYTGSLFSLCELADGVVEEMGTYDLRESNCQHFCNILLKKLHKKEFPTTFESGMEDDKFDYHTQVCPELVAAANGSSLSMEHADAQMFELTERAVEVEERPTLTLSRPVLPPKISDLAVLVNILAPIQGEWKDLGSKLSINTQKLNQIEEDHRNIANQCLREILREYLQCSFPLPTWEKLANYVDEYNHDVANAIIKRAECVP